MNPITYAQAKELFKPSYEDRSVQSTFKQRVLKLINSNSTAFFRTETIDNDYKTETKLQIAKGSLNIEISIIINCLVNNRSSKPNNPVGATSIHQLLANLSNAISKKQYTSIYDFILTCYTNHSSNSSFETEMDDKYWYYRIQNSTDKVDMNITITLI